jgi:DNA-binding Lrp family transcriptional regulator
MISKQADRICEILRSEPRGLSAREVARLLGASSENINSRLSKLVAYGVLNKIPGRTGSNVRRCAVYSLLDTTS